ncbi:creatine kinase, testis isozyme-like isoform X2 [Vanacampus margaritifer]
MEKKLEKGASINNLMPGKLRLKKLAPENDFPDVSMHNNYMAKFLTLDLYKTLSERKTPYGFTIDRVIQTGVDNPGSPFAMTMGCIAGDEETYEVFKELLDLVIEDKHGGYKATDVHKNDFNPDSLAGGDDLDPNYVLISRVRAGRNIRGCCLPPHCTRGERRLLEQLAIEVLGSLTGELNGTYLPLRSISEADQQQMVDDHLLFAKPVCPLLVASGMARDWPDGRGVWHNGGKTFLVWVNEEEHLKLIAIEKGGNMKAAFTRFCNGVQEVESKLKEKDHEFMWNEHLGCIQTCPSNLGTGLRAGVHVRLPNMSKRPEFEEVLKRLRLEKRAIGGVDPEADSGVFDISNSDRLGFTEVQLVQVVVDGIKVLVEMEKRLEMEEGIDDLMPVQK